MYDLKLTTRQWIACFFGALAIIVAAWLGLAMMLIIGELLR